MKAAWVSAIATVVYLLATVGAFRWINRGVPPWLEGALSLAATPGVFALTLWAPLLKRLGLTEGEMVTVPGPLGFVLVAALYAVVVFVVVAVLARVVQR